MEPATDASPRTLKKAASTTFQAFSNSLRSRTQLFYAGSTLVGSPSTSGKSSPEKSHESSETGSPSRKRFGQGHHIIMEYTFSTPDKGTFYRYSFSNYASQWHTAGVISSRDMSCSSVLNREWECEADI